MCFFKHLLSIFNENQVIYGDKNNSIIIWDLINSQLKLELQGHESPVSVLKLLNNGYTLASGSNDHTIKLWNLKTNSCICTMNAHTDIIIYLDELPNERLISGSYDGMVKLWDLNTCDMIDVFTSGAFIYTLKRFENTQLAVAYSDSTFKIWDLDRGKYYFNINSENRIFCFEATSKYLISGHFDGKIKVWNKTNWKVVKSIQENPIAVIGLKLLNLNETEYISSIDQFGVIKIWSLDKFNLVNTLYGFSNTLGFQIYYMERIDAKRLMSRSSYGLIRVWEFNEAADDGSMSPANYNLTNCLVVEGISSVIYFNRSRFESADAGEPKSSQLQGLL
jgi:WD40 repeat protein